MSDAAVLDPNAPVKTEGTQTSQTQPTESWAAKWAKPDGTLDHSVFEKAPDDFKPMGKDLARYKTFDEFLKGHKELGIMASKKGIIEPLAKDATPEQIAERSALLRKVNGAPEKAEGYGLTRPETVPENLWDQKYADNIAGVAHKHGIAPGALQDLAKIVVENEQNILKSREEADKAWFDGQDKLIRDTVKNEGMEYAAAKDLAERAGRKFGVDPANPLMKNATVFMLLSRIGKATKEDELITGELTQHGLSPNMSPEEAEKQANDMLSNKENPAYAILHNKGHKDYEQTRQKWESLLKLATKNKPTRTR